MNIASALTAYAIIWWVVFFMVLPVGNRTAEEVGEAVHPGQAESAPVKPRLWLKVAITTVVAGLLWGIYYLIAEHDLLGFRAFLLG